MIKYELKHENAQAPVRGSDHAAGYDFHAAECIRNTRYELWYDTGVAVQIPHGYFGDLRARSSVSKTGLFLANGAGVVDSDFRGTIQFRFYKLGRTEVPDLETFHNAYPKEPILYDVGDRIGQLIVQKHYSNHGLCEVDALSDTNRGEGGFGSTGT
jgi:dUTP pyrophosphatase